MPDETAVAIETEPTIDIEAASDQIGADLFSDHTATPAEAVTEALIEKDAPKPLTETPTLTTAPVPEVSTPPKSWPKDMHQHWGAVPKAVQDYYQTREKQFLDGTQQFRNEAEAAKEIYKVLTPYQSIIQSKGMDAPRVLNDMLAAYTELTQGTVEQRQAAVVRMAKHFQIPLPATGTGTEPMTPVDPRIQTLEQQFTQLQQAMTAQQQASLKDATDKATKEVNAFASDPTHAFFDEVADDVIKLIGAGYSLQEAYDKAVWANPVTREKQVQDRVQTETEKALERKRLDALPKQKARGVNVNGRDTQRTPTDPLGSMEDTMRSTLKTIKERTAH